MTVKIPVRNIRAINAKANALLREANRRREDADYETQRRLSRYFDRVNGRIIRKPISDD